MTDHDYRGVDGLGVRLDDVGVLRLVLDRPEKRNAIDDTMMTGLLDALSAAGTDERVRVVAIEGAGDHFCGGADIVARNADRDAKPRAGSIQRRLPEQAHRLVPLLCTVQVPVVCKVRGWVAGIGLHLAIAADFAVAAHDARFWEPFTQRGFTPDSGATWLLPRRIGMTRSREVLLLGREVSGTEACEWGMVHRAVGASELDAAVDELVAQLAASPTVAIGLTKWLLHEGQEAAFAQQLANEALALELSSRTEDFREGMRAFGERRPPEFRGR
jgi:2-(1,2-epoxy-1,2-dihydrophenyl)acetyl-CoA isomerase